MYTLYTLIVYVVTVNAHASNIFDGLYSTLYILHLGFSHTDACTFILICNYLQNNELPFPTNGDKSSSSEHAPPVRVLLCG